MTGNSPMTWARVVTIACVAVAAFACAGGAAYLEWYDRAARTVPEYPNASNVRRIPGDTTRAGVISATSTTFDTMDSPADVLLFYQQQLDRNWFTLTASGGRATYKRGACPLHLVTIEAARAPQGHTAVAVNVTSEACR